MDLNHALQTLNCADDDSYIEDESHRRDYLLSDVGVIWRGTSRHKVPLTWEFGQVGVLLALSVGVNG